MKAQRYRKIKLSGEPWIEIAYRKTDVGSPMMDYHYHEGFEIFQVWSQGGDNS